MSLMEHHRKYIEAKLKVNLQEVRRCVTCGKWFVWNKRYGHLAPSTHFDKCCEKADFNFTAHSQVTSIQAICRTSTGPEGMIIVLLIWLLWIQGVLERYIRYKHLPRLTDPRQLFDNEIKEACLPKGLFNDFVDICSKNIPSRYTGICYPEWNQSRQEAVHEQSSPKYCQGFDAWSTRRVKQILHRYGVVSP